MVVKRRRQGLDVKGGAVGDYGWKVEVLRQREQPNVAGSRASGRRWARHGTKMYTRVRGGGGGGVEC